MGLKSFLATALTNSVKTFGGAAGASRNLKSEAYANDIVNSEIYQQPGFYSKPTPGMKHVTVPVNGDRGHLVTIAFHNYSLTIDHAEGATLIYSTDAEGAEMKGKILVDGDGKIGASSSSEDLKTLIDDLIDTISALVAIPGGSPPEYVLNSATIAALASIKSRFGGLLKSL